MFSWKKVFGSILLRLSENYFYSCHVIKSCKRLLLSFYLLPLLSSFHVISCSNPHFSCHRITLIRSFLVELVFLHSSCIHSIGRGVKGRQYDPAQVLVFCHNIMYKTLERIDEEICHSRSHPPTTFFVLACRLFFS